MASTADIVASLRFHATGGRETPITALNLNCIFVIGDENFDCRLLLRKIISEIKSIHPGDRISGVPIQFMHTEYLRDKLFVGARFRLRETRFIADGIVESIVQ